jgi:hypothetical protein
MNDQAPTLKLEIQRRIFMQLPLSDLPTDLRGFSKTEQISILYLLAKYSENDDQRMIARKKLEELRNECW